jgi:hypothetical protein
VRILPEDDVRVGDWGKLFKNGEARRRDRDAYSAYCGTITRLQDSFNPVAGKEIPEVLCFNSMPPDRIEYMGSFLAETMEDLEAFIAREINAKARADQEQDGAPSPKAPRAEFPADRTDESFLTALIRSRESRPRL